MGSRTSKHAPPVHATATALSTTVTLYQVDERIDLNGTQKPQEIPLAASNTLADEPVANTSPSFRIIRETHEPSTELRQGSPADNTTMTTTASYALQHLPEPELEATASLSPLLSYEEIVSAPAPQLPSHTPAPPTSAPTMPIATEEPETQCIVCTISLPKPSDPRSFTAVLRPCLDCNSAYCKTCLKGIFTRASKDMGSMPPRCCESLPLYYAKHVLDATELATFRARYEEWATPRPTYCPIPTCSAFIPQRLLFQSSASQSGKKEGKKKRADSGIGTPNPSSFACPSCTTTICTRCHQPFHPLTSCPLIPPGPDPATAALLKGWGYKACPKCGHGIKRMFGCNHMACRCGSHFCWMCLQSRDECDGGCAYDEGTEYDSDGDYLGPDREENEVESADATAGEESAPVDDGAGTTTASASTEATLDDSVTASEPTPVTSTLDPEPHAAYRPPNLDGGTARYWESSSLDFGDEPTNDVINRSWSCEHEFRPVVISPATAWSATGGLWDCVRCWREVQPRIRRKKGGIGMVVGVERWRERSRERACALVRRDATVGTERLSRSVPAGVAPLAANEDEEKVERLVDTYGNVISTVALPVWRRASSSFPNPGKISVSITSTTSMRHTVHHPAVFSAQVQAAAYYSPAYSCHWCSLVVCESCKNFLLESHSNNDDNDNSDHDDDDDDDDDDNDNDDDDNDDDVDQANKGRISTPESDVDLLSASAAHSTPEEIDSE